jgi:hypothetical protein
VVIGRRKAHVGLAIHGRRRRDIEDGNPAYPVGMVPGHTVGNTATAIMAGNHEMPVTKLLHQLDHIRRHGAFGIGGMCGIAVRGGAVAIAAQIGGNHRKMLGQFRGDPVPHHVGLWKAVKQQQRRTFAGAAKGNADIV